MILQAGVYRFIALCLLSSLEIVEAWCGMDKQQQNSTVSLLLEWLYTLLFNDRILMKLSEQVDHGLMSDVSSLLHFLTSGFILDPNVINCMHTITISFSPVYMCACMHRWPLMTLTSLTPLLTPSLVTSLRSSDRPISTGLSTWEMVTSSTWLLSVRERDS